MSNEYLLSPSLRSTKRRGNLMLVPRFRRLLHCVRNDDVLERLTLTLFLLLFAGAASANGLPTQSLVPGGVATLTLAPADTARPTARFNGRSVLVAQHEGNWVAVAGIPLKSTIGNATLKWKDAKKKQHSISFQIENKDYPEQRLTIKNKRKVNPLKQDLERIRGDSAKMREARKAWTRPDNIALDFLQPTEGRFSSAFGLKRFLNDQPRNPHTGLDIAAPEGAPIVAPTGSRVILTGDFFYTGNTVFLDHGQGLLSSYSHLSRVDVKQGDTLKQGDIIGAIGSTGRVTGPHLHWAVYLNGTKVDPTLFLDI